MTDGSGDSSDTSKQNSSQQSSSETQQTSTQPTDSTTNTTSKSTENTSQTQTSDTQGKDNTDTSKTDENPEDGQDPEQEVPTVPDAGVGPTNQTPNQTPDPTDDQPDPDAGAAVSPMTPWGVGSSVPVVGDPGADTPSQVPPTPPDNPSGDGPGQPPTPGSDPGANPPPTPPDTSNPLGQPPISDSAHGYCDGLSVGFDAGVADKANHNVGANATPPPQFADQTEYEQGYTTGWSAGHEYGFMYANFASAAAKYTAISDAKNLGFYQGKMAQELAEAYEDYVNNGCLSCMSPVPGGQYSGPAGTGPVGQQASAAAGNNDAIVAMNASVDSADDDLTAKVAAQASDAAQAQGQGEAAAILRGSAQQVAGDAQDDASAADSASANASAVGADDSAGVAVAANTTENNASDAEQSAES